MGESNLKKVNGYKIRLITLEELIDLGDCKFSNKYNCYKCNKAPKWLSSTATMTPSVSYEGDYDVWDFDASGHFVDIIIVETGVSSTLDICPVINLLKSSIK